MSDIRFKLESGLLFLENKILIELWYSFRSRDTFVKKLFSKKKFSRALVHLGLFTFQ